MVKADDGYISDYLIHWTGKEDDNKGAENLSSIVSQCQLRLSFNVFHILDIFHKIHEKMVCFTDVPLSHTTQHCKRYGRFGIAFHKIELIKVGAQPVFYAGAASWRDLNTIYDFLFSQEEKLSIEKNILDALYRHFFFVQTFSEGKSDGKDTYYYQREWRLGKQSLAPIEMWNNPDNPKYRIMQAGYPTYCGKLSIDGENEYYKFLEKDVAFIIIPRDWEMKVSNPYNFPVRYYEDYVHK